MTPKDAQELARLLAKMPGIRTVELKDVRKLAELLHEFPELGSIEVKGLFETGVVMTRTGQSAAGPAPVMMAQPSYAPPAPATPAAAPAPSAGAAPAASVLKEIKSPMVGTFYKSPEPGAEAYVKVGSRITAGAAVCIIEPDVDTSWPSHMKDSRENEPSGSGATGISRSRAISRP